MTSTAIVTGASRGFGRAVSAQLCARGMRVVGVARTRSDLALVRDSLGERFVGVDGDASDPELASSLIAEHRPALMVLCAGALPIMAPLRQHSWESFSQNWNVDVKHVFGWVGEALRAPLAPGSTVVTLSSGAALHGSPLSGGYAGAKSAIRFITTYAALEAQRSDLGIDFVSLLPQLTPLTDLGAAAVAAYAAAWGVDIVDHIASMGAVVTPELVGRSVVELAERADATGAYALTAGGLRRLD